MQLGDKTLCVVMSGFDSNTSRRERSGNRAARAADPEQVRLRVARRRTLLAIPALGILLLVILWSIIGSRLSIESHAAVQDASAKADIVATALEQHTVRAIQQIDQITRFVKYEYEKAPADFDLVNAFTHGLVQTDVILQVAVVDSHGKMRQAANSVPGQPSITVISGDVTPVDVSDREHFRYHVQHNTDELFISHPLLGRASKEWALQFARRLNNPDGQFSGVVVVSVSPRYFTSDFYNTAALGDHGVTAVISDDSTVLSRQMGDHDQSHQFAAGEHYPDPQHMHGILSDAIDTMPRFFAYRHLHGYPIGIMAGLSLKDELTAFTHMRNVYLMMTASMTVAIVLFVLNAWQLVRKLVARERKMQLLAETDLLTGMPNRYQSLRLLRREVSKRDKLGHIALLMIGLDNFKNVNDSLGHAAGDQVLIKTAHLLDKVTSRLTSEVFILARSGGDAFLVAIEGPAVREASALLAEIIADALQPPLLVHGIPLVMNASVGIALFTENGENEADLLKKADLAMYSAKAAGKGCYHFYSPHLARRADHVMRWEQELRVALTQKQFFVEYQPVVNLTDGRIRGFETLVRWQHPERGLILAGDFIPIAESTGLILPLGEFVLDTACAQMAAWHAQGFTDLNLAVNVSSVQFCRGDLVDTVKSALTRYDVPPNQLELEITETAVIEYPERVSKKIAALKRLGIRIALDDFGTGYSSLSYLHRFPVDTLKIDRSFVQAIPADHSACTMISAIVGLAVSLGLEVVVEGIENDEQVTWLTRLGDLNAQGYIFSRPQCVEAATDLLRKLGTSVPRRSPP